MNEAWYDILLSHKKGVKRYGVEPRLVFPGTGRVQLRLWSDNFYPAMGWMAPMGEHKIDIRFLFTAGGPSHEDRGRPFQDRCVRWHHEPGGGRRPQVSPAARPHVTQRLSIPPRLSVGAR